ncbi:chromosome 11 open reading frame 70 [Nesidiocoris tenuis]|uniref:Cilia- and flagella-associated protein 300 n=1 Tax=Nesidiocoris tenuis TaxID=355587 RepID=A0ABN7BFD2_9HEMI|nr:chromosome 11 open reading frame 70 [Nesidiocoris tenuis]
MEKSRFTFIPLPEKVCATLTCKTHRDNLLRWGLKGHLRVLFFNFNQEFKYYDRNDFAEAFLRDPSVLRSLEVFSESAQSWVPVGVPAEKVQISHVPCTVVSMNFFDKIKNEENGLVRGGYLTECLDEYVDGMLLQENLRQMLVLDEHKSADLYTPAEKQQFIFRLFKHVCLGGAYYQRSDKLEPYLDLTKCLYKELINVDKLPGKNELRVRSFVLQVVAYSANGDPLIPSDPDHVQDFLYLIIDPVKRQVAALYHKFGPYALE